MTIVMVTHDRNIGKRAGLAYNLSFVNGGDINIQINTDQAAGSIVFDSADLALFSDLEKQNAIQYNLFYRELTNVVYKDKIDNCVVRQLSPEMLDQENSNLNYSLLKGQHMVILTQNVADNLNLSVGDQIYIKLHGNGNDSGQYTVAQIIKPIYGVNVAKKAKRFRNFQGDGYAQGYAE